MQCKHNYFISLITYYVVGVCEQIKFLFSVVFSSFLFAVFVWEMPTYVSNSNYFTIFYTRRQRIHSRIHPRKIFPWSAPRIIQKFWIDALTFEFLCIWRCIAVFKRVKWKRNLLAKKATRIHLSEIVFVTFMPLFRLVMSRNPSKINKKFVFCVLFLLCELF